MILGAIARKISISCLNFTRSSNDKYELVSFEVFKCVWNKLLIFLDKLLSIECSIPLGHQNYTLQTNYMKVK